MLRVIGNQPPGAVQSFQLGTFCPFCNTSVLLSIATLPNEKAHQTRAKELVVGYLCDGCQRSIPVRWQISDFQNSMPLVHRPEIVLRAEEPFEYAHVPEAVAKEIREGLLCYSLEAYNGFAALCRRTIQSMCTELGAQGSTKVQAQISEMADLTGIDTETKSIALEIMLTGHDGSHPHLPDVNAARAGVLLELVRDLSCQLFTRPGNINKSAELRRTAIAEQKSL